MFLINIHWKFLAELVTEICAKKFPALNFNYYAILEPNIMSQIALKSSYCRKVLQIRCQKGAGTKMHKWIIGVKKNHIPKNRDSINWNKIW